MFIVGHWFDQKPGVTSVCAHHHYVAHIGMAGDVLFHGDRVGLAASGYDNHVVNAATVFP